jgi:prepilin-type N-terminal cleavage/methylation domain-containing protein
MQRGFTIIELLISVFILGIMLTFTAIQIGDFNEKKLLNAETRALAERIAELRAAAIAGNKFKGQLPEAYCARASMYTPGVYVLFADFDGDTFVDFNLGENIQTVSLPKKIVFTNLPASLVFCFKVNETYNNLGPSSVSNDVIMTLMGTKTKATKKIIISKNTGTIDIDGEKKVFPAPVLPVQDNYSGEDYMAGFDFGVWP